jgi:hypothetical protein
MIGALAIAGLPAAGRGQGTDPPTISHPVLLARFPDQVRAAEAGGARYPRSTTGAPASPRHCVDASGAANARSGDFLAGPFRDYPTFWYQGTGKLWFRPTTVVAGETLLVRARSLDKRQTVHGYRLTTIAETFPIQRQFYPSHIHLPSAGPWLLIATVGQSWGCFLFVV